MWQVYTRPTSASDFFHKISFSVPIKLSSVSRLTIIFNDQNNCSSDDSNNLPLKCKQMGLRSSLIGKKSQKVSKTKTRKKEEPNKQSYLDLRWFVWSNVKKLANFKLS
jgi:hypothetical protein